MSLDKGPCSLKWESINPTQWDFGCGTNGLSFGGDKLMYMYLWNKCYNTVNYWTDEMMARGHSTHNSVLVGTNWADHCTRETITYILDEKAYQGWGGLSSLSLLVAGSAISLLSGIWTCWELGQSIEHLVNLTMRCCCDCRVDAGRSGQVTGSSLSHQKKNPWDQTNSPDPTQDVPNSIPTHSCTTHKISCTTPICSCPGEQAKYPWVCWCTAGQRWWISQPTSSCLQMQASCKPTPEQTVALNKYCVAHKCYDEDYQDEVLIDMYKCMGHPLDWLWIPDDFSHIFYRISLNLGMLWCMKFCSQCTTLSLSLSWGCTLPIVSNLKPSFLQ